MDYEMPYNNLINRKRKFRALMNCKKILVNLQDSYAPIFRNDPMITSYIDRINEDLNALADEVVED